MRMHLKWLCVHKLTFEVNGSRSTRRIRAEGWRKTPRAQYFPEAITSFGTVRFEKPGTYRARLKADEIAPKAPGGVILTSIELLPA